MQSIAVSREQAERIANADDVIEVCDAAGEVLGYIAPRVSDEEIAIARGRMGSSGARLNFDQVLAKLRSLDEK